MDLSIIIPVYNTPETVLQRCFDSVSAIKGISYEVILSDDGSADETGRFCKDYILKHPDFHYFYKENGGASSARNAGLSQAQGNYIAFLDADDAFLPQCLTPDLFQHNHELVIFDILLDTNGTKTCWQALDCSDGILPAEALLRQLIISKSLNSPCAKLFRRDILQNNALQFDTGFITGEDWFFVQNYILHIRHACYKKECAQIYYRDIATSLSRLANHPDTMLDNLHRIYQQQLSLCNMDWAESSRSTLQGIATAAWMEHLFNIASDLRLMHLLSSDRKKRIRQAVEELSPLLCASNSKKAKLKAKIILHYPIAIAPLAFLRRLYLKLRR